MAQAEIAPLSVSTASAASRKMSVMFHPDHTPTGSRSPATPVSRKMSVMFQTEDGPTRSPSQFVSRKASTQIAHVNEAEETTTKPSSSAKAKLLAAVAAADPEHALGQKSTSAVHRPGRRMSSAVAAVAQLNEHQGNSALVPDALRVSMQSSTGSSDSLAGLAFDLEEARDLSDDHLKVEMPWSNSMWPT